MQKILEILRRDVPRPTVLPKWDETRDAVCWDEGRCAMGLHPLAKNKAPLFGEGFGNLATDDEVREFGMWFDSFVDPVAAVEAVWGSTVHNSEALRLVPG